MMSVDGYFRHAKAQGWLLFPNAWEQGIQLNHEYRIDRILGGAVVLSGVDEEQIVDDRIERNEKRLEELIALSQGD